MLTSRAPLLAREDRAILLLANLSRARMDRYCVVRELVH